MELKITRETRIWDLKKQFGRLFPYLKLELCKREHKQRLSFEMERRISDPVSLGQTGRLRKEGSFVFTPVTTVSHFEEKLQNEYGLSIQVFRKAGDAWIETIQTDYLSLDKQNAMGQAASIPIRYNLNSLYL